MVEQYAPMRRCKTSTPNSTQRSSFESCLLYWPRSLLASIHRSRPARLLKRLLTAIASLPIRALITFGPAVDATPA